MEEESRTHRVLAGDSRAEILSVIRDAARPMSVADVAAAVDLHVNTVRGHLELLADTGFLQREAEHRGRPGRPRVLYATTARPVPSRASATEAANYRILARVLVQQIVARAANAQEAREIARRAGQTWAEATAELAPAAPTSLTEGQAYDLLVTMMRDLGFDPHPEPRQHRVVLHACPYLDGPREDLPVVCGVHQGLLEGTLARLGAPLSAVGLDVRLSPTRCVVHLDRTPDSAEGSAQP